MAKYCRGGYLALQVLQCARPPAEMMYRRASGDGGVVQSCSAPNGRQLRSPPAGPESGPKCSPELVLSCSGVWMKAMWSSNQQKMHWSSKLPGCQPRGRGAVQAAEGLPNPVR